MEQKIVTENYEFLSALCSRVLNGAIITQSEAQRILSLRMQEDIVALLAHATMLRNHFKGTRIDLCAVVNAKSGRCPEDCIFCAQSAYYKTDIQTYPLLDTNEIIKVAKVAKDNGVNRFGIVTSGKGITSTKELDKICESIREISQTSDLIPCASLGILSSEQSRCLRDAGLKRYHHNLETAESHFPEVCSTHSFDERIRTVVMAKKEGFEICSGGIFGLGETIEQRIELAFTLRDLDVDSVPLNFLNPIAGTPTEKNPLLPPLEILKTIALFRFILPEKDVRVCGGREISLRTLQPLMYLAGANGTMVGNYLTTSGRDPRIDLQEIMDLGFTTAAEG
ncbi:MAG: biotin synthase [Deltaproteobacteria bacterium DG_8]|nr:MAG: biotin synthase [Deltaproteobacteria bacterium DG_8]